MVDEVAEGHILDGKYRIEKVIGRGGMGVVVSATHLVLDELVAIKFLTEEALYNEEAVARFEREARASVKIKSEHVVRVMDVGRLSSGAPYMVMEFLTGEDLAKRLETRGPLPVEQAVDFVLQACMALAGAHGVGIVHRDIKPANLFCVPGSDGHLTIKVLDFGISKLNPANSVGSMSVTKTAAVMGSPLYMSPEQVQSSKDVDSRTDVWSLGVVLFELIAGKVPFFGEAFGEVCVRIATQPLPPLTQYRRDIPPGLDDVLRTCLAKDRKIRFASVAELAVALQRYASPRGQAFVERIARIVMSSSGRSFEGAPASGLPASAVPANSVRADDPTVSAWADTGARRSNKRALVWGMLATVLVLGAGGAALMRRGATPPPSASAPSVVESPAAAPPAPTPIVAPIAPQEQAQPSVPSAEPAPAPTPAANDETPEATSAGPSSPQRRGTPAKRTTRASSASPAAEPRPAPLEPAPAAAPRPAPAPAPAAAPRAAAPKADCDPPFTLDAQGRKKFKPECFLK